QRAEVRVHIHDVMVTSLRRHCQHIRCRDAAMMPLRVAPALVCARREPARRITIRSHRAGSLRLGATQRYGSVQSMSAPSTREERPMTIRRSTSVTGAALLGTSALLLAACSPGSSDDDSGDGGSGATTVTFRLWDEAAAAAYEESFATFEEQHTDIDVEVETVPWANYWDRLPQDIG